MSQACEKWLLYIYEVKNLRSASKKFRPEWMDGWVDGWKDGWMEVKAILRIAYSNKKDGWLKHLQKS